VNLIVPQFIGVTSQFTAGVSRIIPNNAKDNTLMFAHLLKPFRRNHAALGVSQPEQG
jgi:hypothetical protein